MPSALVVYLTQNSILMKTLTKKLLRRFFLLLFWGRWVVMVNIYNGSYATKTCFITNFSV